MNQELLNKLRKEAGFGWGVAVGLYTHDVTEMWVEYDKDGEECWPSREIMEKFALLIVRECAKSVKDWYQNHDKIHSDPMSYVLAHFGVEE